jgi:hypothetical protein
MTTIVTRLFADAEKANAAAAALRKGGFSKQSVSVISGHPADAARAAISAAGVYAAGAAVYAAEVAAGKALVVCHAPFAKSLFAQEIMDEFDPVAANVKHTAVYVPAPNPPSKWAKSPALPTLLNTDYLVLSDGLFPPAVIRSGPSNSILSKYRPKAGLVSGTISEKLGLPQLWRRSPRGGIVRTATPFSSALKMPVLSSDS